MMAAIKPRSHIGEASNPCDERSVSRLNRGKYCQCWIVEKPLCGRESMKLLGFVVLFLATSISQAIPCGAPENRQFDFWIGDWQVHKPDGSFAGMNRITLEDRKSVV